MNQGKSEEQFLAEQGMIMTRRENTNKRIILRILISKKIMMSWIAASTVLSMFRIYIDLFVFQVNDLAYIFWVTIREQIVLITFMTIFLILIRWRLVRVYWEFLSTDYETITSQHGEQINQERELLMHWLFSNEGDRNRFQQGVLKWWNGLLVPVLVFSFLMVILLVIVTNPNLRRAFLMSTYSPGNYVLIFRSESIQAINSTLQKEQLDLLFLVFLALSTLIRGLYPIFYGLTSVIYLGIFTYYLRHALKVYQARLLNTLQHLKLNSKAHVDDDVPRPEEFQWLTRPIISSAFWIAIVIITSLLWADSVILARIILRGSSELNNLSFYLYVASVLFLGHVIVLGAAVSIFVLPLIPIYHVNRQLKAHYLNPLRKRYVRCVKNLLYQPTSDPSFTEIAEELRILREEITALEKLPALPFNYKSLGVITLGPLISFASLVLSMLQKLFGLYL